MKTILLIEDNEDILDNMAEILKLADYKVITASNGKAGAALAMEHKPDLIICDIMMPELDGYGVIHLLQKNIETRRIPFIFLTAKAEHTEIRKGMQLGADDYIIKPFNGTELLNSIECRIKKSEQASEPNPLIVFNEFNAIETLRNLRNNRKENSYKKKQLIYQEGNHPSKLFYLLKGKVKTFKINDEGKEFVIGLYNEGEFFGYNALLEESVYKESAETLEDCEIAMIPKEEFEDLINSNHEVLQEFVHMLANNVTELEQQLLGLAYNSLRKKVADTLIILTNKYKNEGDEKFVINISRENLANIAGTAKESLIRTLSDFKDEKLIDIVHGDIKLLQEKKLKEMFN